MRAVKSKKIPNPLHVTEEVSGRDLGISQTMSPRSITTGLDVDYNKHCRIEYGQYVQTHEKHDNSMVTRAVGALALRPTGNQQGGY
jgi:hypothetical protein